ncbi:MAG: divergent polysaccharide deacetylase family protein [Candidatus Auribacterota bacterium]
MKRTLSLNNLFSFTAGLSHIRISKRIHTAGILTLCVLSLIFSGCAQKKPRIYIHTSESDHELINRICASNGLFPIEGQIPLYTETTDDKAQWVSMNISYGMPASQGWDSSLQQLDKELTASGFTVSITQTEAAPPISKAVITLYRKEMNIASITVSQEIRACIAIVIDDLGYNKKALNDALAINRPITYAVLPHLAYSKRLAETFYTRGDLVILHQPMQPLKDMNPGPGAIYSDMTDDQVRKVLSENIASLPHIAGVNNHMGSKITTDPQKMRVVFRYLQESGYFFLDSVTEQNKCLELADELNFPIYSRDVFLDNKYEREYISGQLDQLAKVAVNNGYAIGIGHFHPVTMQTIREKIPELERAGIKLVYLNELPR